MALAKGGVLRTTEPTLHTRTQIDLVRELLGNRIDVARVGDANWEIVVHPPS
jgi:RNA 3'-terminal phosphate cyclase (ATP)